VLFLFQIKRKKFREGIKMTALSILGAIGGFLMCLAVFKKKESFKAIVVIGFVWLFLLITIATNHLSEILLLLINK
jgi:hypothetical protein